MTLFIISRYLPRHAITICRLDTRDSDSGDIIAIVWVYYDTAPTCCYDKYAIEYRDRRENTPPQAISSPLAHHHHASARHRDTISRHSPRRAENILTTPPATEHAMEALLQKIYVYGRLGAMPPTEYFEGFTLTTKAPRNERETTERRISLCCRWSRY
jgi:hypothetical protein